MKNLLFLLLVGIPLGLIAQPKAKWDVSNPTGQWNFKDVPLSTDEGTWMNLDVSPDGNLIVFDLLGDIYKCQLAVRQRHCVVEYRLNSSPDLALTEN